MVIVYASDDSFVEVLGISIISLFENNQNEEVNVFVLSDGISDSNKNALIGLSERYHQTIKIIEVNADEYSTVKLNILTWSRAAFNRLFIGTILEPYKLNKIIYLDCDTVVNGCIKELWEYDLGDACIGMTVDPVSKGHKKNVGITADKPYYNSGVLLIDLIKWKNSECEVKLKKYALERRGRVPYVDQGLINGALKDYITTIPLRYNLITVYCDYNYGEMLTLRKPTGFFYSKDEVETAINNPVIIHYTKSIFTERPWIDGSTHKKKYVWDKYKDLSPWKDVAPKPKTLKGSKRILVAFCQLLPRKISVELQGFLHAVVKHRIDEFF